MKCYTVLCVIRYVGASLMCRNAKCCRHANAAGEATQQWCGTDVANSVIKRFRANTVSSQLAVECRPSLQWRRYDVMAGGHKSK